MSRTPKVNELGAFRYLFGADALGVKIELPHGAGTRSVDVHIEPHLLVTIGKALDGCTTAGERGHALWHVLRPAEQRPCSSCERCDHPAENRGEGNYCSKCGYAVDQT